MLESTEKGSVRNSIRNCLTVFQNDPLLSGAIAKNLLTERVDIVKPIGYHRIGTAITDTDMNYLLLYLEETYGLTSEKKITAAIGIVANENGYHPVRDYLNGLSWDGQERIRYCLRHFLGADTDQYTYEALRLFLLGAIHRAFCPGCKFEVMLCLVGGQGAGKSTFFRLLAVKDEWFSDDLRKLDDDTAEWQEHGVQQGKEYAILTDEITKAWSGMTTRQYKKLKGLKKENLRDNMSTMEIVLNMLAEATTTELSKAHQPEGFSESQKIARRGGNYAGQVRQDIEKDTGRPVITSQNAAQLNAVVVDMIESVAETEKPDNDENK